MGDPGLVDEATHGDDRVGQVEERVDYRFAAFIAALEPVERVVPGVRPLDNPTSWLAANASNQGPLAAPSDVRDDAA